MSALLVVCGGKDYQHSRPRTEICIIDQQRRESGRLVREIFIEVPLFMGEAYVKRLARRLGVYPICLKIARNERIATWIFRYDRKGAKPVRRIFKILKTDSSVLRIRLERFTYTPAQSKKLA